MNGRTLMVIGVVMTLQGTGFFMMATEWIMIVYSTQKLRYDTKYTTISFQVGGTEGATPKRFLEKTLWTSEAPYQLAFDAGAFDLAEIGAVDYLAVSRKISLDYPAKNWKVTKFELVSPYWLDQKFNYTFACNCWLTLQTPDHRINLHKQQPSPDNDMIQVLDGEYKIELIAANGTPKSWTFWISSCLAALLTIVCVMVAAGKVIFKFRHKIFKPKPSE